MKKQNLKRLCISAIFLALGVVLSELIPSISLPFGGSVTFFSMVPVCLIAIAFGTKWGIFSGLVYGVIQMMFGIGNVTYAWGISAVAGIVALLFDYVVAYGVLGLAGVFKGVIKNPMLSAILGVILALLLRFICHFVTGVTIWREIADTLGAIWYSITYNGAYMLPELIITPIGVALLIKANVLKVIEK